MSKPKDFHDIALRIRTRLAEAGTEVTPSDAEDLVRASIQLLVVFVAQELHERGILDEDDRRGKTDVSVTEENAILLVRGLVAIKKARHGRMLFWVETLRGEARSVAHWMVTGKGEVVLLESGVGCEMMTRKMAPGISHSIRASNGVIGDISVILSY